MTRNGQIIEATFTPVRTDDLKPGMAEWIGRRCRWEALWSIEEDDNANYAGQWAWNPTMPDRDEFPYIWVPTEDLSARVLIEEGWGPVGCQSVR